MSSTHRSTGTAIALLVAVLACVILLLRDDADVAANGELGAKDETSPTADAASANAASAAPTDPSPVAPDLARTSIAATPQPVLKVRLRSLHPLAPWTQPIRIDWEGRDEAQDLWLSHDDGQVPTADLATFSLPEWVRTASQQKVRLRLRDPDYAPVDVLRDEALSLDEEFVIDVQVRALLRGRVVDARGEPVVGARVAAFAREAATVVDACLGWTNTRNDGTFTLQAPPGVELFVVAVPLGLMQMSGMTLTMEGGGISDDGSIRDDLLPSGVEASAQVGKAAELVPIVLPDAAPITGTLQFASGKPAGGEVAVEPFSGVTLALSDSVRVQRLADGRLAPIGRAPVEATTGSFVLPGVAGVRTAVAVVHAEGVVPLSTLPRTEVVAPAQVALQLPGELLVRVLHGNEPAASALLEIEERQGEVLRRRCDENGTLRMFADGRVRMRARDDRAGSSWREIDATREREVVLTLDQPRAEVAIEFAGAFRVRNAKFTFVRDDGTQQVDHGMRDDRSGPFVVHVEPGRYVLHVGAGGGERNGVYLLPQQRELEVGTARMAITLRPEFGGRLQVNVTDARGIRIDGLCRVVASDGSDRTACFLVRDGSRELSGTPGELLAAGTNELESLLPAGRYALHFDLGARGTFVREVTIAPREVAEVLVRLP